jgi:hypothetical protein
MKNSILLALTLVAASIVPVVAQPSLLNSAYQKNQAENFAGAIQDLQTATQFFFKQKDWKEAYKSRALMSVLQSRLEEKEALESGKEHRPQDWYRLGQCIGGKDICEYSVAWLTPDTIGTDFDGIVVLQKSLRQIPNAQGGSSPVQSITDAQVVPKLKGGENLGANCTQKGAKSKPILAIYQARGFENAEFYTQVRAAWQVNMSTQKIVPISPRNVVCENPCPGGC